VVCDHASRRIPRALGTLGLSNEQMSSHIAWDIGAAGVAGFLADRLRATLVLQNYSRLVIDCNRVPGAEGSIPIRSDNIEIGRNVALGPAETAARVAEIFDPYHDQVSAALDRRQGRRMGSALVAVHSFVPVLAGVSRPWHIGVMYRRDAQLARALLRLLGEDQGLLAGDNEPYALDDTDYTIPRHAERRGLPHVCLELRQDLIADESAQSLWAKRLALLLERAARPALAGCAP
jgi:predicted N-formylglutamate amidohydrolase